MPTNRVTSLAGLAAVFLLWPAAVARAEFAIHRRDTLGLPSDYARLFDTASGNQTAYISYSGTTGNPNGYYLQSLDYDATTGSLFGLVRGASLGNTARVLRWSSSGALLAEVPLNGYPTDGTNHGMDMSVHNGVVAVHRRDSLNLTNDYARLFNAASGSQIATLSYSGTAGNPSGYYLQSLDYDATSGNLFGLVCASSLGSSARLLSWNPSGALLADVLLNGYPTDGASYGMDMTVHDGIVAVHRRDSIGLPSDYGRLFDATTGNQIGSLSYSGVVGIAGDHYIQSLDFDATTGNLWGIALRSSSNGYTTDVMSWSPSGALLSDIPLNSYPTEFTNYGMDIAVLTVAPEPSTFALIGFGLATLAVFGRRRRRSSRRTLRQLSAEER